MPIKRSSDQKSMTLEEFYIDMSKKSTNFHAEAAKNMLVFVGVVNEIFKETVIWGLTSHDRLVIQNTDDWKSNWFVIVSSIGTKDYYFEYLLYRVSQKSGGKVNVNISHWLQLIRIIFFVER